MMCFAPDLRVFQPCRCASQLVLSFGALLHTRAMCVLSFRLISLLPPSLSFGGRTRQRRHPIRRPLTKAQSAACEMCTCEPGHVREASKTGDQPTTPPMCLSSSSRLPRFPLDSNSLAPRVSVAHGMCLAAATASAHPPCRCVSPFCRHWRATDFFQPGVHLRPPARPPHLHPPLPHPPHAFVFLGCHSVQRLCSVPARLAS